MLRDDYGWESDLTYGSNQWRMGDGQTAFNNFIYYHLAGITEYDSYRSHQVREGVISREKALECIKGENKPKYSSIDNFFQTIGMPYEEVMKKIVELDHINY